MNSDYQQKKMMNALGAIDTKGNIVLEQFQDGTALLFQPGNAQPFCVATDYDRATASWSYGKYFSDLGCAHEAADPEIIEDASVRWVKEDIREKLKAQAIEPTEFNVQSVIMGDSRLWGTPSRQGLSRQHDCERQRRSRCPRYHSQGKRELQERRHRYAGGKS